MKISVGGIELDLDKPVERVSVVDLICPRRGWYAYREPVSSVVSGVDEMVVAGQLVHAAVLNQLRDRCRVEVPVEVEVCGQRRRFRADAVCDGYVIELKKRYGKAYAPLYIWQLKVYMALLNVKRGYIVSLEDGYVKEIVVDDAELRYVREVFLDHLRKAVCGEGEPERRVGQWCNLCKFRGPCLSGRLL